MQNAQSQFVVPAHTKPIPVINHIYHTIRSLGRRSRGVLSRLGSGDSTEAGITLVEDLYICQQVAWKNSK